MDYGPTAAGLLGSEIQSLLRVRPFLVFAVCGGRSVVSVFDALQEDLTIDWQRIHIFLVDDRLVPTDHPNSNGHLVMDRLAKQLIESGRLPFMNLHLFQFQPDRQDSGCEEYIRELNQYGGRFDIVLLSAGEDGHIAGLFPNHIALENTSTGYISFHDSPKPPSGRMTATLALLKTASYAVLLISEEKKNAYGAFFDSTVTINTCPAKIIFSITSSIVIKDVCLSSGYKGCSIAI